MKERPRVTSREQMVEYWRWSHPDQKQGATADRQESALRMMALREGWDIAEGHRYNDDGKSGYYAYHLTEGDLGRFVREAKEGQWGQGTILGVEDQDRFARVPIRPLQQLLWDILDCGVSLAIAHPYVLIRPGDENNLPKMLPFLFQGDRAHQESARKSGLVHDGWARRKQKAREGGYDGKGKIPGWFRKEKGQLAIIARHKETIEMIFNLAIGGNGASAIVKALTDAKRENWGYQEKWDLSTVQKILAGPTAYGGYQPKKRIQTAKGSRYELDGDVIENYYPAVISKEVWKMATAAIKSRRCGGGRRGESEVNLFSRMLWDDITGERLHLQGTAKNSSKPNCLAPPIQRHNRKRSGTIRFPYLQLEFGLIDFFDGLRQTDVASVEESGSGIAVLLTKAVAREKDIQLSIADIRRELSDPANNTEVRSILISSLRSLTEELKAQSLTVDSLRRRFDTPMTASLAAIQAATDRLALCKNDAERKALRMDWKQKLRRMVDQIWIRPQRIAYRKVLLHCQIYLVDGQRKYVQIAPIDPPLSMKPENLSDVDFRLNNSR